MKNSAIEWTHHTFNPWLGCAKVSPGCRFCYAEHLMQTRLGRVQWGASGTRVRTSEAYWRGPLQWNAACAKAGRRERVFCASLADVFEDFRGLDELREDLFELIERTAWLDWQLLTKRPEVMQRWIREYGPLQNVWCGVSVENEDEARNRIPVLVEITQVPVRFLSCEPLLGPLDLELWLNPAIKAGGREMPVNWVICGGESGHDADVRPLQPDWVRALREQCAEFSVPFFFKQWGEYLSERVVSAMLEAGELPVTAIAHARGFVTIGNENFFRVRKEVAGRLLDGLTHDDVPRVERGVIA